MPHPLDFELRLQTRRLVLRPLRSDDFEDFSEVRNRCESWLTQWEPAWPKKNLDPSRDRIAFASRCAARERERQLGTSFAFGIFFDDALVGELNATNVYRGVLESANIGYWVDEKFAGLGIVPEALVGIFGFIFDDVGLHRLAINIVPRNTASRRVMEKLEVRAEGLAERYLKINGEWEDHVNYAITAEEWQVRAPALLAQWVGTPDRSA